MKTIKQIIVILLFLAIHPIIAQEFNLPKEVNLEKESDYVRYQTAVLNAINWLENTKIKGQEAKRKNVNAFVLQWMMGTPSVTIGVQAFQIELTEKNPELLTAFLGGWTKFALVNPDEKENTIQANIAGFQSLMKVYIENKGNGMKKDKRIEKLIKLDPSELEKWVQKKLK